MKLFLQKNAKFLSAGGSAFRPPLASSSWGLRPQTPQTAPPPIANFWLRACAKPWAKLKEPVAKFTCINTLHLKIERTRC